MASPPLSRSALGILALETCALGCKAIEVWSVGRRGLLRSTRLRYFSAEQCAGVTSIGEDVAAYLGAGLAVAQDLLGLGEGRRQRGAYRPTASLAQAEYFVRETATSTQAVPALKSVPINVSRELGAATG